VAVEAGLSAAAEVLDIAAAAVVVAVVAVVVVVAVVETAAVATVGAVADEAGCTVAFDRAVAMEGRRDCSPPSGDYSEEQQQRRSSAAY